MVPDGSGARYKPERCKQSQPRTPTTFQILVTANILSALILVPHGAILCVHGIKMHDVALGERIIATRVLRLDGPSSTRDVSTILSRMSGCRRMIAWASGAGGGPSISRWRMVAIEFGTCRSGRNGGSSGSVTVSCGRCSCSAIPKSPTPQWSLAIGLPTAVGKRNKPVLRGRRPEGR
jgi:hypothetical protein